MDNSQERHRGSPQDLPCVWMMAGVVQYRLCDRNYDCEHCELYHVMRGESGKPAGTREMLSRGIADFQSMRDSGDSTIEKQIDTYLSHLIAGSKLYLDRCYSPNHFWMYPYKDGEVAVGLDTNILRLLSPVRELVPPETHISLRKNQLCGWIIRGDMTIPLHAPVSGQVTSVNSDFLESFYESNDVPDNDEWLFTVVPKQEIQILDDLCRGDEMLTWYAKKIQMLKQYLRTSLIESGVPDVGATLADGGEPQMNLELILGEDQFAKFVSELFHIR